MIQQNLLDVYPRYMRLTIFVDHNYPELYNRYYEAVHNHNRKVFDNIYHVDAGFDLFAPIVQDMNMGVSKIDFGIKCSAQIVERGHPEYNTGFYLHPRSSIVKTPLRLANSTGIIDAGYRGNIIGAFDMIRPQFLVNQYDRFVQICAPGLMPILVEMVDNECSLGGETQRSGGGFGSTGI
jgi:dUTP pyrophosphatase